MPSFGLANRIVELENGEALMVTKGRHMKPDGENATAGFMTIGVDARKLNNKPIRLLLNFMIFPLVLHAKGCDDLMGHGRVYRGKSSCLRLYTHCHFQKIWKSGNGLKSIRTKISFVRDPGIVINGKRALFPVLGAPGHRLVGKVSV